MGQSPEIPSKDLLDDSEFQEDLETWRKKLKEKQLKVVVVWAGDDAILLVGDSGTYYFETWGYIHKLGTSIEDIRMYLIGSKNIHEAPCK